MDSDGCFSIPISNRNIGTTKEYITTNPMLRIGWGEYTGDILIKIRDRINVGNIYYSNSKTNKGIISWQTTNWYDAVEVCKKILPYMLLKKRQCENMIIVGEKFLQENKISRKFKHKELILEICKVSCELNPNIHQTERYRSVKNYDYWKQKLDFLYPDQ